MFPFFSCNLNLLPFHARTKRSGGIPSEHLAHHEGEAIKRGPRCCCCQAGLGDFEMEGPSNPLRSTLVFLTRLFSRQVNSSEAALLCQLLRMPQVMQGNWNWHFHHLLDMFSSSWGASWSSFLFSFFWSGVPLNILGVCGVGCCLVCWVDFDIVTSVFRLYM